MERVVTWRELLALIEPHYPKAGRGRRPYPMASMLRIHVLQNWFGLSDPAMEEALYEIVPMRQFAQLPLTGALPDETTVLNFRRLLETHQLAPRLLEAVNAHLAERGLLLRRGTIVDATIIAAAPSTKNKDKKRDPEMHQTRKGNQWHFGMKAHIGVDGREREWHIAEKRGRVKKMEEGEFKEATKALATLKARFRAHAEHPFRVVKRQFGYQKVRFKGLMKNTAQVITLFALSNLWMVRRQLLAKTGELRPQPAKQGRKRARRASSGEKHPDVAGVMSQNQNEALLTAPIASVRDLFRVSLRRLRPAAQAQHRAALIHAERSCVVSEKALRLRLVRFRCPIAHKSIASLSEQQGMCRAQPQRQIVFPERIR